MPEKRARRTRAEITDIRDAIKRVMEDDPPMTVRQVFYQLVARGVIEKTEEEYHRTVIRLMTEMRLDGQLPYSLHRLDEIEGSLRHAATPTTLFGTGFKILRHRAPPRWRRTGGAAFDTAENTVMMPMRALSAL